MMTFTLLDDVGVNQLLQNTPEALLCDLQYSKQVGDHDAGITLHKMQNPVVGAAELELRQNVIRIAGKFPIGKEQKFDEIVRKVFVALPIPVTGFGPVFPAGNGRKCRFEIYVSHIDLILVDCYLLATANEMIGLLDAFLRIRC
jgi:hypothetical protein